MKTRDIPFMNLNRCRLENIACLPNFIKMFSIRMNLYKVYICIPFLIVYN